MLSHLFLSLRSLIKPEQGQRRGKRDGGMGGGREGGYPGTLLRGGGRLIVPPFLLEEKKRNRSLQARERERERESESERERERERDTFFCNYSFCNQKIFGMGSNIGSKLQQLTHFR